MRSWKDLFKELVGGGRSDELGRKPASEPSIDQIVQQVKQDPSCFEDACLALRDIVIHGIKKKPKDFVLKTALDALSDLRKLPGVDEQKRIFIVETLRDLKDYLKDIAARKDLAHALYNMAEGSREISAHAYAAILELDLGDDFNKRTVRLLALSAQFSALPSVHPQADAPEEVVLEVVEGIAPPADQPTMDLSVALKALVPGPVPNNDKPELGK